MLVNMQKGIGTSGFITGQDTNTNKTCQMLCYEDRPDDSNSFRHSMNKFGRSNLATISFRLCFVKRKRNVPVTYTTFTQVLMISTQVNLFLFHSTSCCVIIFLNYSHIPHYFPHLDADAQPNTTSLYLSFETSGTHVLLFK